MITCDILLELAKKKKTQLKPVARGFATTSVPKKVTEPVQEEIPTTLDEVQEDVPQDPSSATAGAGPSQSSEEFNIDNHEEQSLQLLVDKYQEKIEKEVSRTIKVRA